LRNLLSDDRADGGKVGSGQAHCASVAICSATSISMARRSSALERMAGHPAHGTGSSPRRTTWPATSLVRHSARVVHL